MPGGREIAAKTFNPRLGIEGGLSILGTTGIVRPYCTRALRDALKCTLDVAAACRWRPRSSCPAISATRAARRHFSLRDEQVIEAGNEWGFVLDLLSQHAFRAVMLLGHPGKLAKLAAGQWDTHSSRSGSATHYLSRVCPEVLGHPAPDSTTAEGVFAALPPPRKNNAGRGTGQARANGGSRPNCPALPVAVFLINMAGECLGTDGDFDAMAMNTAKLSIVGCGPGSARYVTEAARQAVARADVLVGGKRLMELFPDCSAERILVGADISRTLAADRRRRDGRAEDRRAGERRSGTAQSRTES